MLAATNALFCRGGVKCATARDQRSLRPAYRSAFVHPRCEADTDEKTIGGLEPSHHLLPGLGSRRMHQAVAAVH